MSDIKSILFICTGNSCRSAMAEGLLRKRLYELGRNDIEIYSAGMMAINGFSPPKETIEVMKEKNVDVSTFKTKNVTPDMIKKTGLIFVMEPMHKEKILKIVPAAAKKTFLLKEYGFPPNMYLKDFSVQDPIGKPIEDYRACRDEIIKELERIEKII